MERSEVGWLVGWLVGWCLTTVPVTKTIRLSEWVTPGDTAIPGMISLKDGDLQHSSALAQSPKGDVEPQPSSQKLIRNRTAYWSRSDGRSRRYVQYRADQSQTETIIAKRSFESFSKRSEVKSTIKFVLMRLGFVKVFKTCNYSFLLQFGKYLWGWYLK